MTSKSWIEAARRNEHWRYSALRSPQQARTIRSMTADSLGAPVAPVALVPIEPRCATGSWTAATHGCPWSGMLERGEG